MWLLRSLHNGLLNKQPAEFSARRRKAFSVLIFTLLYNLFLGLLLFLGEDIVGAFILLVPSGFILFVLIMIHLGRLRQADIENAARPYMDYTPGMRNSFEHISDVIKESNDGYYSS